MKKTLIAALLVTSTSAFASSPFAFQKQFGSEEYVPGYDAAEIAFTPIVGGGVEPSYFRVMLQANVDHIAGNAFEGEIVGSGPTRISLYEAFRDSPEGTAYRSYHERYAADHDWTQPGKAVVASKQATSSGDS